jgi:hypothetical protein
MFYNAKAILLLICLTVLFASFVGAQKKQPANSLYIGCWGGTHGGLLRISSNKIYDLLDGKKYFYKYISKQNGIESDYLLELKGKPRTRKGFITKFIALKFLKKDDLAYFGYDSIEDYQNKSYTSMGEFIRQDCKTIQ